MITVICNNTFSALSGVRCSVKQWIVYYLFVSPEALSFLSNEDNDIGHQITSNKLTFELFVNDLLLMMEFLLDSTHECLDVIDCILT